MKWAPYIMSVLLTVLILSCGSEVGRKGSLPFEGPAVPTPTPEPGTPTDPAEIPFGTFSLTPPVDAQVLQVFQVSWSAQTGADHYDVWFSANADCKNAINFAGNITNLTAQFLAAQAGEFSLCQLAFDGTGRAWKPTNNGVRFTIVP